MPEQPPSPYHLDTAQLDWQPGNVPEARDFGDIYFLLQQGLEETRYVFLQHNQLQQRWPTLQAFDHFSIGETGFGTGLNFLASWQLWQNIAPQNAQLHFVSVEKHPLSYTDLERSLSAWPELTDFATQLLEQYPTLTAGYHLLKFDSGRISLHLLLGDGIEGLEQLRSSDHPQWKAHNHVTMDAWFLDGFSPAKNPDLWNDKLYSLMADLSGPHTTVATFTAVTAVRKGLAAQGFEIKKDKGFRKREMLFGQFNPDSRDKLQPHTDRPNPKSITAPWYFQQQTPTQGKHIAIIGGGLAGCSSAYALAQRGCKVTLIERSDRLAAAASGNPQGMLYTKLSTEAGTLNRFTLSSYLYALRFYRQWQKTHNISSEHIDFCGVLQLASNAKEQRMVPLLQQAFANYPELIQCVDQQQASELAGVDMQFPGWFFPAAGWVSPVYLCQSLSSHPNIDIIFQQQAITLEHQQQQWQLSTDTGPLVSADAAIIANSHDALHFEQSQTLPTKTIRGQITLLQTSPETAALKTVICHEGYITPAINNTHNLGATFDNGDTDTSTRQQDHQRNLDSLHRMIPSLLPKPCAIDTSSLTGRAGLRCTSPDYLPMVGPVHDQQQFLADYAPLRKNAHAGITSPGHYYPNLYLNIGHGSRGLTSTPLCSELIAAMICSEPLPLPRHLVSALNPARFVIRDLIRNKV
ncbi:bifunctional tRNA (5-methylaminomethyl-2-thiouridine)(34)-methyltransferase MnmD/FAD-dependent 5-carboxymethylaminomethyl-2-thiouridine(34) oxidoreductase MnmC [Oceanicoccus sagamiensis]|uniref:tRNA 5-methylaminomethyl-2-thiouridine biosynthesis bifunctional protein MnmC n=1 Tax=Oceanicoccus sagamiensis TaxID=716816 RepID=A0A1X9NDP9_9GAMM|nr:bifunctional tRNA (5-methylaminomethyl-2-thiouridine)(34)-methyltransferase MnmD/FAD-dependent 5-carboxymethylaminomethyl-2-thiouridine(34) oxidoreductase MnmC [Oceanicoccus sagamiensis]ARN75281.1 bifunctional tRNA (5-methylaminomethyl-2-thiouridine)(34)-methyltransferase MnmD/FAD-dependent 5-carboxymethylaminomethyl-2-thiouridine(34) oxidoreductase MnmC [Oceanicoccus sagamiensis]